MDKDLLDSLMAILLPVATSATIALLGYVTAFFRAKVAEVKNETARKAILAALDEANRVATEAVLATKQILVDGLKAKAADGKLTKDEATEALNMARDYFMGHMTKDSITIITAAIGPIEEWLGKYLEAKISDLKFASVYDPLP
jgi:hypothetical protein